MNDIAENAARSLDPFGFFNGYASCIRPLGGPDRGPDPAYAFHTPYMEYRPGPVIFTIRIDGLAASFGELVIHVNSFIPGSGAHALLVTLSRVQMAELAAGGEEVILRINALADVSFAVFGYFPEGTDATASALTIDALELGTVEDATLFSAEAQRPTRFGSAELRHQTTLVRDDRPFFRKPVSQIMTTSQLGEDTYLACIKALAIERLPAPAAWKQAFALQALDAYGMLQPGAHGLALADATSPLAASFAARGCSITIAMHVMDEGSEATLSPRRYPALCADPLFDARCSVRGFDPAAIDEKLCGFDFLWSIDIADHRGSAVAARTFIQQAIRCLRPGGYAVHMFDILMDHEAQPSDIAIERQRLEAIALTQISMGVDVMQLNFARSVTSGETDDNPTPFGLIMRRGL